MNYFFITITCVLQVSSCDKRQRYEKMRTQALDLKTIKVKELLELVGMDLIGGH